MVVIWRCDNDCKEVILSDMHSLMSVRFLVYLWMTFYLDVWCLVFWFNDVLGLVWMCDECTGHHKTVIEQLYWHFARKLYQMRCSKVNILQQEEEDEQSMVLPPTDLEPGILPTEIRKLVESRRQVKQLMKMPDISQEQLMQVTTTFRIK